MFLSVDTDTVRGYGRAASGHAAALHDAASRLTAAADGAAFGPVGARFLAVLRRAADEDAQSVTGLGGTLAAAREAAQRSAQAYDGADARAASRIAL